MERRLAGMVRVSAYSHTRTLKVSGLAPQVFVLAIKFVPFKLRADDDRSRNARLGDWTFIWCEI